VASAAVAGVRKTEPLRQAQCMAVCAPTRGGESRCWCREDFSVALDGPAHFFLDQCGFGFETGGFPAYPVPGMDACFESGVARIGHDVPAKTADIGSRQEAPIESCGYVVITFERFTCRFTTGLVWSEGEKEGGACAMAPKAVDQSGNAGSCPMIGVDVDLESYLFHSCDVSGAYRMWLAPVAGTQEKINAAATLLPSPARTLKVRQAACRSITSRPLFTPMSG